MIIKSLWPLPLGSSSLRGTVNSFSNLKHTHRNLKKRIYERPPWCVEQFAVVLETEDQTESSFFGRCLWEAVPLAAQGILSPILSTCIEIKKTAMRGLLGVLKNLWSYLRQNVRQRLAIFHSYMSIKSLWPLPLGGSSFSGTVNSFSNLKHKHRYQ